MEGVSSQSIPRLAQDGTAAYRWLRTGEDALVAMLKAIGQATQSIRLEIYIFVAGPLGALFRDTLVDACRRQVRVRVLIDALGSLALSKSFWNPLIQAGGEFSWFNPLKLERIGYRDHRKILVCDDRIAIVGGFNIAPEYRGDGVTRGWRDLGLEISGPLAKELAETFDEFFARAELKHRPLQRLRKTISEKTTRGPDWQLLLSGPGRGHNALKHTLINDLNQARNVKIISAYFLPTWRIRKEFNRLARSGVPVQLILAGKSDVLLSLLASRRLYQGLLRAGIEIYEYQPQILHAKLVIIDEVVYAGSANLDARSLNINYELLVRVSNQRLAEEAREIFAADLKQCRRIDPATWRKSRSIWEKLMERWAHFILARVDPSVARYQLRNLH
ncbi:MAG: hypothetical protein DME26_21800 [Verrucomicrobia bacterium]|nr:MAG: hypothetical protein DME26_21800 [Verrucomicrobiota bacterium]